MEQRKIKFRAWDDHRMVYQTGLDVSGIIALLECIREDAILMQFTGLLDKNGKEIYEGDIVRQNDYSKGIAINYDQPTKVFDVHFRDGCFIVSSYPKNTEVIGNIYENLNLLK